MAEPVLQFYLVGSGCLVVCQSVISLCGCLTDCYRCAGLWWLRDALRGTGWAWAREKEMAGKRMKGDTEEVEAEMER